MRLDRELGLSLALHVLVVSAATRVYFATLRPPPAPAVRPSLEVRLLIAPGPAEPATQPSAVPATVPSPTAAVTPLVEHAEPPASAPTADKPPPERPGPLPEPAESPASPPEPTRAPIDWEASRRAAIAAALEERDREEGYRTFSRERPKPFELPEVPQIVGPDGSGGAGAPSLLAPSRAKTAFGRKVAQLCADLTGGISLFGLASACVENEIDRGQYWYFRPEYLKKRPVCADTSATAPALALERADEYPTIKCRLSAELEP